MTAVAEPVEGWAYPTLSARKAHFFRGAERRSLCGRYALVFMPTGMEVTPDTGSTGPQDCAVCARKLEAARRGNS